jgi:hypothetical protein
MASVRRSAEVKLRKTYLPTKYEAAEASKRTGKPASKYRFGEWGMGSIGATKHYAREVIQHSGDYTRAQIKTAFSMFNVRPYKTIPNHLRRSTMAGFTVYVTDTAMLEKLTRLFGSNVDADGVIDDESGYAAWARVHL